MEKPIEREILDSGWLTLYGKEAVELGLNKSEMAMCSCFAITPAQFKASKDNLACVETLVGQTKEAESFSQDLTPEQRDLCKRMGVSEETFKRERAALMMAGVL
jgi:hypothetical protein